MRFPSRASIMSGRRKPRRHSRRPTVASLEPLERRLLLAGDVFGNDAFASMTALTTTATGSAGVWEGTGAEQGQPPTTRVSTTTRVSDDGTSGVTITVSERWDSPDSWTRAEFVSGWYDVSDGVSDATGSWSVRVWGAFTSSYTMSFASGTMHHALVESGMEQVSESVAAAWSGSSSHSTGSVTQTWQADSTNQFTAASSGTTRAGVLTGFSGNERVTGTSSSSWSMAAGIVNGVPGGTSATSYLETGSETHALGYSTRSVLDRGGRIVTTGDGFEQGSGSGGSGLTVHAATLQSVTFVGGSAAASNTMHEVETERWDHSSSVTYVLGPLGWRPVAGSASSGSEGSRSRIWSAAANVSVSQVFGTASVASQASGLDTASHRFGMTSTVSGGRWVTVGSGAAIGHGSTSQTYRLGGSESSSSSVATSRSTLTAHGNHASSYGYAIGHGFDDRNGWRAIAGTVSASQHGGDHAAWTSTVQTQPWVSWGSASGPTVTGGSNDQTYAGTMSALVVAPGVWRSYGSVTTTVRGTSQVGLSLSSHGSTRSHSLGDTGGWQAASAAAASFGGPQAPGAAPTGSGTPQSWSPDGGSDWDPDTDSGGRSEPRQADTAAARTATSSATEAADESEQHAFEVGNRQRRAGEPDPSWTSQDRDAAVFADAVYFKGMEGIGFKRFGIEYESSHGFAASLFEASDGTFYLSFRGTDGWNDVPASLVQGLLGLPTSQYQQAIALATAVQQALPSGAKLILTGHSLGGGLAAVASYQIGLDAITFNASRPNWYYTLFRTPGRIRSHVTFCDPLTIGRTLAPALLGSIPLFFIGNYLSSLPGTIICHRPRHFDTHSMWNFLLKPEPPRNTGIARGQW